MTEVAFDFYVEPSVAGEITWKVTADVTRERGHYLADLTSACPEGDPKGEYDVSDLEAALADEGTGRTLDDVKQAAVDALVEQSGGR